MHICIYMYICVCVCEREREDTLQMVYMHIYLCLHASYTCVHVGVGAACTWRTCCSMYINTTGCS